MIPASLKRLSRLCLGLYLLLAAWNAFTKTLGDFVIREERRVGANTLFVGDSPGAGYASQAFIQFDDSGMISHLYTGTRCAWPNAASDLSHMIVYDINKQNGCLIIVILEDSKPAAEQTEEGMQTGRRVEEDFARRETDFEQQQGLIPRKRFSKEQIGLRAEFASNNRLLVRSSRTTAEDGKEFNTAVAYDFHTKVFSVPSAKEFERIKAVNFGEAGLERPDSAPARLAAAPAAQSSPAALGNIVIGEERTRGPITLYTGNTPGAEFDSQLFIQDNASKRVSQISTGARYCWPDAASDQSRLIVYDGIPHTPGSLVIFARQQDGTYRRVEEDFTRREVEFEQAQGLILRENFDTEYIGLRAEFSGTQRILLRNYRRTDDRREFNTEVGYDFPSKSFFMPKGQEHQRLAQVRFGEEDDVVPPRDTPALSGEARFIQVDSWGVRSILYLDLFLSALNDPAAIQKMAAAGWIEVLWATQEVSVVNQDLPRQMFEVRPAGKIETFWVAEGAIGALRPQGRQAEISHARYLIENSSARIEEFIEELRCTNGLSSLAEAITRNGPEVTLALANLKSQDIDFKGELKTIEAAYNVIKNAPYHREMEVLEAQSRVARGNLILVQAVEKAYQALANLEKAQTNQTPAAPVSAAVE
jgi:hypothetical protein